jgi:hypothetical protein
MSLPPRIVVLHNGGHYPGGIFAVVLHNGGHYPGGIFAEAYDDSQPAGGLAMRRGSG